MKSSEVKKMQALSIRRDDFVSDENWFQMMRDIFFGYENEVMWEKSAEQKSKEDAEAEECASVDKGNNIAAILEIVRLAMKINASEKTEVQAFVSISPHISEVQVDIYNSGWSYDTYPNVTYRARYDFPHQDDETMTNYIPEIKVTNVNCNVDYMQKKLCELVTKKVERND